MGSRFFVRKILIYPLSVELLMWKQRGPRNNLQRRISKSWALLLSSFLTCLATSAKTLHLSLPIFSKLYFPGPGALQVHSPVQEPGAPRCCRSSRRGISTQNQAWGAFRTVPSGHSLKHRPLNAAVNSSTTLWSKSSCAFHLPFFYVPLFT